MINWLTWHLFTKSRLRRLEAMAARADGDDLAWLVEAYDDVLQEGA